MCTNQYLLWIRSLETALQPGAQGRPSPDLWPLLLGFLRTYRSCCPITLNVWHKNTPLQLRMLMKKGCGQSSCAWENIVWCFAVHKKGQKDPVASVLLPSCRSVCVCQVLEGDPVVKAKCIYHRVSLCDRHYVRCTGSTVPPACI